MTAHSAHPARAPGPARHAKRQTGEVRRQQIAEAALRILAAHGPNRLTAAELAREVGIADGTIFRHFRDKAEIVRLAIDHLRALLSRDLVPPTCLPPLDRLDAFVRGRLALAEEHRELYSLALGDRLREAGSEADLLPLREVLSRNREFVEGCLREAQEEGSVDPRLPVCALTLLVVAAMHMPAAAAGRCLAGHDCREDAPQAVWSTLKALLCNTALRAPRIDGLAARAAVPEPDERRIPG